MAESSEKKAERPKGPELRLIDRRAFIGFPELALRPGVTVTDFALQIPDVTFPFNVTGGPAKYQRRKLDFGFLELYVDAEVIVRNAGQLAGRLADLEDIKLHFRPGYLEAQGRLKGPERAALTFKVAFDGDGDSLAVYLYDVRFYAFASTPAARIPALVSDALKSLDVLPDVERRGANGFSTRLLPSLVEASAVGRGYKMPALDSARLVEASVSSKGLRFRFAAGGLPPPSTPDEELLLALEGARAFAEAEELLAEGKLREARTQYLRYGDATEAHPFAVERLLTLLVADPTAHELALDVAQSLQARRDKSATALWAEAVVRERRGEAARASERFLALCNLARKNQEEAGAFFAAEAGARAGRDHAPQMAAKALHELLGIRPDHLPSLKALARASDQAQDRAGAMRAYRRLAALARDPAEAADAHVHLARLAAQTEDDLAGARLHCEAALRLSPDHPDALMQLSELCFKGGEFLRAIKSVDRLREVAMGRHEVDRIGRANLLAGKVWEQGLKQPENALLRYREAVSLLPGEPEPLYLTARVADSLGKLQESVSGYQQAIELAGPSPRTEAIRNAAHQSHHALARLYKAKLGEPARAREHLESAIQLYPTDLVALDELLPYYRASGKAAELADAAEKAAQVLEEPARRSALWAEAGELYRGRLAQPEKAERLLSLALEADPKNRIALEGMLALAESRRDGGQLCRCLKALAELADEGAARVRYYRRLAVAARDLAFDLDLAANAYTEVLKVDRDDLPTLGELCALHRRRSDWAGLSWALEMRAQAAEAAGDKRLAAAAMKELSTVHETRLGRMGEALVAMEKAARLFPEAATLMDLANLSLRCERPLNARRALEDVLATLPKHASPERLAEVRSRLGRACDLLGDKDAARVHYAQAFPLRRLDDELAVRLEQLYEEGGFSKELVDFWTLRAQALMHSGRAHDAAVMFFKSAQTLLKQGDSYGAQVRLSSALEAAPKGERAAETLELLAELELKKGEKLEAAKLLARRAGLESEGRAAARLYFRAATLAQGTSREESYLGQALQHDLSFVPARLRRAQLSLKSDPGSALLDLEAVLSAASDDADVLAAHLDRHSLLKQAGMAALASGQLEPARRLLAQLVEERPDDVDAASELAQLHRKSGALEPLINLLQSLWPKLSGERRVAARREYAEGVLALGRTEAATEVLRAILEEDDSDSWAAARLLALLPVTEETASERGELISQLIEASTGDARAELLTKRAGLHQQAGDLAFARDDLTEAAELSSSPLPLLLSLAALSRSIPDDVGELSAWKRVLSFGTSDEKLERDIAERMKALAASRTEARDFASAREVFELWVTLPAPAAERHEAWAGLAQTALRQGDKSRAEKALMEASAVGPAAQRVAVLLQYGRMLEERDARAEAVTAYENALALAPRHPEATAGLKRTLRAAKDFEGLAEVLAAEAAHTPKQQAAPLYRELYGLYSTELQQKGPAEAALRKVVALDADDVDARAKLSILLAEKGELEESTELLEQAAKRLPDADAARLLREGAARIRQVLDPETSLRLLRHAHQRAPASGADLVELAEMLFLHGSVTEALPLQKQVVKAVRFDDEPEGAEVALLRLADLAEQTNDLGLAESTLRRLVAERPLSELGVERLSELVRAHNPREALGISAHWAMQLTKSAKAEATLLALARRAATEVADFEFASQLLARAIEVSDQPLKIRAERAQLLREAGRQSELRQELLEIAQARHAEGDVEGALEAWEEEADLAESLSHIDEALSTWLAMAEVCEEEGLNERAAELMLRRATLLTESKLDLHKAIAALEKAWELHAQPSIAQRGMELARRLSDRNSEIDWLEKSMKSVSTAEDKAALYVKLAHLHLGGDDVVSSPLLAPEQAEAAFRAALKESPAFLPAERGLLALFERQERLADVAAYYEESAMVAKTTAEKARLLLMAAELYKERAQKPHEAAAALLAARAADPDDAVLTAKVADQLYALGRVNDAADFDALLLEADPKHAAFARHHQFLKDTGDEQGLAVLLTRRAERETGEEAAAYWLKAAQAFVRAGAPERARLCEDRAFDVAPANEDAFGAIKDRVKDDPRRFAEVLLARARSKPDEAAMHLEHRARVLEEARESLLAAAAWDDYLEVEPNDVSALERRSELAFGSSGPKGAQPFDRRLIRLGGESLSSALRRKVWMRLGSAALESEAFKDAVDAFEQAFDIEPSGERGREALSLLAEAASHARNFGALYRATLRMAERSSGAEQEALYRRAATLFDDPAQSIEALSWLSHNRPADAELYARTQAALVSTGRLGELLELHERHGRAVGGAKGAEVLLAAAKLAERELHDETKAGELRQDAFRLDDSNINALEAVVTLQRGRGDEAGLLATLPKLAEVQRETDLEAASATTLELASLHERRGELPQAREVLTSIRQGGPSAPGYAASLEALERVATATHDSAALADILSARSELVATGERSTLLFKAAVTAHQAGQHASALEFLQSSLSARVSLEGLLLLADVQQQLGEQSKAAAAWAQAADLAQGDEQPKLLLRAADAWETAGASDSAVRTLERVWREFPQALGKENFAERLLRLGATAKVVETVFAPAMESRDYAQALRWAERLKDESRIHDVLWAMVQRDGSGDASERLWETFQAQKNVDGAARLAELLGPQGEEVWLWLFEETGDLRFLDALTAEQLPIALTHALEKKDTVKLEILLAKENQLSTAWREKLYRALADSVSHLRVPMLKALEELFTSEARAAELVELLLELAKEEESAPARRDLQLRRGALLASELQQPARAKQAYELALQEDSSSVPALTALLPFYGAEEAESLTRVGERLEELGAPQVIEPHLERLADAYEKLGKKRQALVMLARLPEKEPFVTRRLALAKELGLTSEALRLSELLAKSPADRATILMGYLDAQMIPSAVRVGTAALQEGTLNPHQLRILAERLSSVPQGAELALRVWPGLLKTQPVDADGWTLYAAAFRQVGRMREMVLADGFGAALTMGESPSAMLRPEQVNVPETSQFEPLPEGLYIVDDDSMPRLSGALYDALEAMGAKGMTVMLDEQGGVEAWQAAPQVLVLGLGALTVFGPSELIYLCALALALGDKGRALRQPGEVEGFIEASIEAFDAYPVSLAACRVLARLDSRVRGGDPNQVAWSSLLVDSPAFLALAKKALEKLN